ncbi:hypothetical protein VTN31DRAFT_7135 [Thermomyces dupontii]|uniref:uncharacterized protein n=1 Tax=Talaromyces thermophilus TaxID=28565 RepID=UPI003742A58C
MLRSSSIRITNLIGIGKWAKQWLLWKHVNQLEDQDSGSTGINVYFAIEMANNADLVSNSSGQRIQAK